MPGTTAPALPVACVAAAAALFVAGAVVPAFAAFAASFVFDIMFVLALRAGKQDRR